MKKKILVAMLIAILPLFDIIPSGIPSKIKIKHENGIANFLCNSTKSPFNLLIELFNFSFSPLLPFNILFIFLSLSIYCKYKEEFSFIN